jgi:tRNA nucleotidyltransferase (CCA-adding enzyme)
MNDHDLTGARLIEQLRRGLNSEAAAALRLCVAVCQEQGAPLFLVGGAVRDLLLGRSHVDLDLAVEGETARIAEALALRTGGRAVLHPRFGTATVSGAGFVVDLVRSRRESYAQPGALPDVEPAPLLDDLRRRDFTINAMALRLTAPAGEIVDPFGGQDDIERGLLRVLHEESFRDDATRMLRGVRYAARLGFRFDDATEAWLRRDLPFIDRISGPRLRRELALLFEEPGAAYGAMLAHQLGLLTAIHPALAIEEDVVERWGEALAGRHQAKTDELGFCLLAIRVGRDEVAAGISHRLHLTGRIEKALLDFVRLSRLSAKLAGAAGDPVAAVALLEHVAPAAVWALSVADDGPASRTCEAFLNRWRLVKPLLTGRDLLTLGIEQGAAMGQVLDRLREARLQGRAQTRDDEVELVQAYLREGRQG